MVIGRSLAVVTLLAGLAAGAAGCSEPQEVIASGANGVDGQVGDVMLRGVRIAGPDSPRLEPGDDALAWLVLIAGREPAVLTDVTSDAASRVEIRWDRACDGTTEPVEELPLAPNIGGPGDPSRPGADEADAYHLRLIGFTREVLVGTNVPVTFRFAQAGEITLQVPVIPDTEPRTFPSNRCHP